MHVRVLTFHVQSSIVFDIDWKSVNAVEHEHHWKLMAVMGIKRKQLVFVDVGGHR